eukprot:maker-scaffold_35-snap-gene-0.39-mRNA-1 protein AED:0.44 eAED:0.82 QI:0/0/0/1/1/1/4/0/82
MLAPRVTVGCIKTLWTYFSLSIVQLADPFVARVRYILNKLDFQIFYEVEYEPVTIHNKEKRMNEIMLEMNKLWKQYEALKLQ